MLSNRVALDDYLSIADSSPRSFHFWKAIGNLNWQLVYWTECRQVFGRKAQKEEDDDER